MSYLKENQKIIKKQNINLHNFGNYTYTEYPHKSIWSENFNMDRFQDVFGDVISPFLLYLHIPFCRSRCLYCLCHTTIIKNYESVEKYLTGLYHEMDLYKRFFKDHSIFPLFKRIHVGGGSPSIIRLDDFERFVDKIRSFIDMDEVEEFAVEVDPRRVTHERLELYHKMGVNRFSFGIQDFDPMVQRNINRMQPVWLVKDLLTEDVKSLFGSINFDILCGLPGQTRQGFKNTIQQVIDFSPDRIMLMFLSLSPSVKKHQRYLFNNNVPSVGERIVFWEDACETLLDDGYVRIGVDHFAKPSDVLAGAFKNRMVHWNSLGYGVGKNFSILGLGSSSSSDIKSGYYFQNSYSIDDYLKNVSNNRFPVFRGHCLSKDDVIRRDIIHRLRCFFYISFCDFEDRYGIDFRSYFNLELSMLDDFKNQGMVDVGFNSITVNDSGKHFIGFICKVFDKYRNMKVLS